MSSVFRGKVRDISSQGLGVVDHPDGRVFFVRGTWPGDEGEFEIESLEKKYGFARLVKRETASPDREPNPCQHSGFSPGQCGGCPWLGIKYDKQLEQKQKMVSYLLNRTGAFEEGVTKVKSILPSPKVFSYRNRAQFKTEGAQLGFVSPGTKQLAPIEDCLVLSEKNRATLKALRTRLPNDGWKPTPPYLWNYIEIDEDVSAELAVINKRRTFKQANDEQNRNMKNWLRDKLKDENKTQKVLELFCGSGNFTEVLAELGFSSIVAVEGDERAVEELAKRGLPNVKGIAADLFRPKEWKDLMREGKDAEILVLDPPREGFRHIEEFVPRLRNLKKIYYISCDPASFTTEARFLKKGGWHLTEVQPVDQFPHTSHVELLGELVKNKN